MHRAFQGMMTPLITPLAGGELDVDALVTLIEMLLERGEVSGLIALGTTGEGPLLGPTLSRQVIVHTARCVGGRVPLVVNVSSTDLERVTELARFAAERGAEAVTLTPPWYYRATDDELIDWCVRVASASPLPVLLYNMPSHAGAAFHDATYRALMDEDGIIGVKDSGGDWHAFERLIDLAASHRDDWTILAGPEAWLVPAMRRGASGATVSSNQIAPEAWAALHRAAIRNDPDAQAITKELADTFASMMSIARGDAASAKTIKAAMSLLGLCRNETASPLRPCSPAEVQAIGQHLSRLQSAVIEIDTPDALTPSKP